MICERNQILPKSILKVQCCMLCIGTRNVWGSWEVAREMEQWLSFTSGFLEMTQQSTRGCELRENRGSSLFGVSRVMCIYPGSPSRKKKRVPQRSEPDSTSSTFLLIDAKSVEFNDSDRHIPSFTCSRSFSDTVFLPLEIILHSMLPFRLGH